MNVETYARLFLLSRGYHASEEGADCVSLAAKIFLEEQGVQLKLSDLRSMAAMAQFSEREMRHDVLQLIAVTGHVPGDVWVSMDPKGVRLMENKTRIDAREVL